LADKANEFVVQVLLDPHSPGARKQERPPREVGRG